MGQLDDLLNQLASEGTKAASGEFGIDTERAREKLERFQLQNPYEYLIELAQAAHLLGATRLDVECDADEMWMRFDGQPLDAGQLSRLYEQAMGSRRGTTSRALWHIAVALNAVKRLEPSVVRIESGDAGEGAGARWTRQGDAEDGEVERGVTLAQAGTHIYVRERFRPRHLEEFASKFLRDVPELYVLKTHLKYSDIEVHANEQRCSSGLHLPGWRWHEPRRFEAEGIRGVIGVSPQAKRAELSIVQHGALITTLQLDEEHAPFHCVVEANHLERDLSLRAFVQNDDWRVLFEEVLPGALRWALLESLQAREDDAHWPRWAKPLMLALMRERVASGGHHPHASAELKLIVELKHLPMWRVASPGEVLAADGVQVGQQISVVDIRRGLAGEEYLLFGDDSPLFRKLTLAPNPHGALLAQYMGLKTY